MNPIKNLSVLLLLASSAFAIPVLTREGLPKDCGACDIKESTGGVTQIVGGIVPGNPVANVGNIASKVLSSPGSIVDSVVGLAVPASPYGLGSEHKSLVAENGGVDTSATVLSTIGTTSGPSSTVAKVADANDVPTTPSSRVADNIVGQLSTPAIGATTSGLGKGGNVPDASVGTPELAVPNVSTGTPASIKGAQVVDSNDANIDVQSSIGDSAISSQLDNGPVDVSAVLQPSISSSTTSPVNVAVIPADLHISSSATPNVEVGDSASSPVVAAVSTDLQPASSSIAPAVDASGDNESLVGSSGVADSANINIASVAVSSASPQADAAGLFIDGQASPANVPVAATVSDNIQPTVISPVAPEVDVGDSTSPVDATAVFADLQPATPELGVPVLLAGASGDNQSPASSLQVTDSTNIEPVVMSSSTSYPETVGASIEVQLLSANADVADTIPSSNDATGISIDDQLQAASTPTDASPLDASLASPLDASALDASVSAPVDGALSAPESIKVTANTNDGEENQNGQCFYF
ncbi:hypothetical protein VKT23_002575 [Stygiomarasmius scandens]|uniref:Uncharacterized protein n=1 Tax=Marasmiellus scandens TaxID=2682957 RepID=A0ABR1K2U4_9AGAR